jgi:guanylate kinase
MLGWLHVISGPSGVGKSTIIRLLMERIRSLQYSISYTSRKPRIDEKDGRDYHFVDRETFVQKIDGGDFVEWARVYDDFYGTAFSSLRDPIERGLDVILDLDSQGALNIRKHFSESTLTYVLPPSLKILSKRLRERATDVEEVITMRIEKASDDLKSCIFYDYILINDDLDETVTEMESIIIAHRCRTSRMLPEIESLFGLSGEPFS